MTAHYARVHRADILQQILTAVTTGRGAVVTGQRGTGRTTVVELVMRQLPAARYAVTRTTATEAGHPVPFGVFSGLVPVTGDPALVLGRLRAELLRRSQARTPVLVVEDAQWVDKWSASTLLGLAHDGQVRLVVTTLPNRPTSDAVLALWKDRHLRRVDLPPLGPSDTTALMQAMLGAGVASTTAHRMHTWTGGNPRLATELVRHGLTSGRLFCDQGLWCWHGPLVVPPRLVELLLPEQDRLSPTQRDALAAVAMSEHLPIEMIDRIAPDAVEELEDRGLLRTRDTGNDVSVGFGHPLLRAIVQSQVSPARRRRVAAALLGAADAAGTPPDPVTSARWQVAAGGRADPAALTGAARLVRPHDPEEAVRLARLALRCDRSVPAAVVLAGALAELGEGREAQSVLHQATAADDSATGRAVLSARLAVHRCAEERDPAAAHADLRALRSVAPAVTHDAVDGADALILLIGGRPLDALRVADGVLSRSSPAGSGSRTALRCQVVRAAALALTGRTAEAVAAGTAVAGDAGRAGALGVAGLAAAVVALAALWRDGTATLPGTDPMNGRWPAPPGEVPGTHLATVEWPLLAGYALLVRCEYPEAVVLLREALAQQADGCRPFRSEAAAWLAVSLATTGDPDEAQRILETTPPDGFAVLPGLAPWARAAIALARGDTRSAGRQLAEAVSAAHAAGCPSVELQYLTEAAKLPLGDRPTGLAERIGHCLERVDAPRLVAEAGGELMLLRGDAAALIEPATRLADLGQHRRAWRLAEAAVTMLSGQRDADRAAAVALAGRLRAVLGLPTPAGAPPALTIREAEVAALAAAGLPNREIASRLVVSARTVESHLVQVYRKLGIDSRRQLQTHWFGTR